MVSASTVLVPVVPEVVVPVGAADGHWLVPDCGELVTQWTQGQQLQRVSAGCCGSCFLSRWS